MTRHLGFQVDLSEKVISVTTKHRRKIIAFFDRFLMTLRKTGRLLVKDVQRMLGLQIWISTVFRVARQFLTSICDLLREVGASIYFYPRRHRSLVARIIVDLKFWRRFVSCKPKSAFKFVLGHLPANGDKLASDASSGWGMAGVLIFGKNNPHYPGFGGLFWQITWTEWEIIRSMDALAPGGVKINVAEFLAALITCETFSAHCSQKFTTLEIDNVSAKVWLDSARCPTFPFDRCAQGVHLHMLDTNMKIRTSWIPSADNKLADTLSRERFSMNRSGHCVNGVWVRRVKPRWQHVNRFL